MATASVQHTFAALTDIKSSEANKNFSDLVNFLNNQVIHADASRPFTAIPSGPPVDPTSADQLVRKAYVDGGIQAFTPSWTSVTLGGAGAENMGRFWKIGKTVHFFARFKLGAGGSVGASAIALNWAGQLPAAHADHHILQSPAARAWADDNGSIRYGGIGIFADSNPNQVSRFVAEGDSIGWRAGVPFVWSDGNLLVVQGEYLSA